MFDRLTIAVTLFKVKLTGFKYLPFKQTFNFILNNGFHFYVIFIHLLIINSFIF